MAITGKKSLDKLTDTLDSSFDTAAREKVVPIRSNQSTKETGVTRARGFARIELSQIVPDPHQPRKQVDEQEIASLAESLQSDTGQIQPTVVQWSPLQNRYRLVAGERRYRAALLAGWPTLDCKILDDNTDERQVRQIQLVENLKREDLKPLEEALAIRDFQQKFQLTGKQTAQELGISESRVSRSLGLLKLPSEVQDKVATGEIPPTLAYELTKLKNEEIQKRLAAEAAQGQLTARSAARAVNSRKGKRTRPEKKVLTFLGPHNIKIVVHVPQGSTYHHVLEAGEYFVEDVKTRTDSRLDL